MRLPSKMAGSPKTSPTSIFLHCLHLKWLRMFLLPSTSRDMKEAGISPLTLGYLLHYLGLWILMSTCSGLKRGDFLSVTPFDQESNPCLCHLSEFMSKRRFNAITREIRFTNTNPPPYVDKFWKILQMVKACNDHMTSIFLASWEI